MFRSPTVFVLGSGSSKEVGLPTGERLCMLIAQSCDFDYSSHNSRDNFQQALTREASRRGLNNILGHFVSSCWAIRDAMGLANSIDQYLDMQSDDKDIQYAGKLAIVTSILNAERDSSLTGSLSNHHDLSSIIAKSAPSWFGILFKMMHEGIKRSDIEECFSNVTIINFNYDRCIEQFINAALMAYFGIPEIEACHLTNRLRVLRPYGRVGRLPFQPGSDPTVSYGNAVHPNVLADLPANLRTFNERITDHRVLSEIKEAVSHSAKVVFLGFAFHPINIELLAPDRAGMSQIYGTSLGLSPSDVQQVKASLARISELWRQSELEDQTCFEFMNSHRRSLVA